MSRHIRYLFLLAPLLIAAASDDDRRASTALFREAEESYADGFYEIALDQYLGAFNLYAHPGFHARIGACHQALGDHQSAVESFERFLSEIPDAPNREEVEDLLDHSRSMLASGELPLDFLTQPSGQEAMQLEALDLSGGSGLDPGLPNPGLVPVLPDTEEGKPRTAGGPLHENWWFWAAVAGVAVVAGGATAAASRQDPTMVLPSGTLGTIDRR